MNRRGGADEDVNMNLQEEEEEDEDEVMDPREVGEEEEEEPEEPPRPPMRPELVNRIKKALREHASLAFLNKLRQVALHYGVPAHIVARYGRYRRMTLSKLNTDTVDLDDLHVGDYVASVNNEGDYGRWMKVKNLAKWVYTKARQGAPVATNPVTNLPIDWNSIRIYKITKANPDIGATRRKGFGKLIGSGPALSRAFNDQPDEPDEPEEPPRPPMRPELVNRIKKTLRAVEPTAHLTRLMRVAEHYNVPEETRNNLQRLRLATLNEINADVIDLQDLQVGDYIASVNNEGNHDRWMRVKNLANWLYTQARQGVAVPTNPLTNLPIDWSTIRIYKIIVANPDIGATRKKGYGKLIGSGPFTVELIRKINTAVVDLIQRGRNVDESYVEEAIRTGKNRLRELPITSSIFASQEDKDRKTRAIDRTVNELKRTIESAYTQMITDQFRAAEQQGRLPAIIKPPVKTSVKVKQEKPPPELPTCPVCLDPMIPSEKYIGPCGHQIHKDCYSGLQVKDGVRECPLCRLNGYGKLKGKGLSKQKLRDSIGDLVKRERAAGKIVPQSWIVEAVRNGEATLDLLPSSSGILSNRIKNKDRVIQSILDELKEKINREQSSIPPTVSRVLRPPPGVVLSSESRPSRPPPSTPHPSTSVTLRQVKNPILDWK
jgi:hypothetical protein